MSLTLDGTTLGFLYFLGLSVILVSFITAAELQPQKQHMQIVDARHMNQRSPLCRHVLGTAEESDCCPRRRSTHATFSLIPRPGSFNLEARRLQLCWRLALRGILV